MSEGSKVRARTHVIAFVALVVLAGASFGLSFLKLGVLEMPVALGIAAIKAVLIAAVFMHLVEEPGSRRLAALGAVVMVALLVSLAAADVVTRH